VEEDRELHGRSWCDFASLNLSKLQAYQEAAPAKARVVAVSVGPWQPRPRVRRYKLLDKLRCNFCAYFFP
jgi:hypothetical protein